MLIALFIKETLGLEEPLDIISPFVPNLLRARHCF